MNRSTLWMAVVCTALVESALAEDCSCAPASIRITGTINGVSNLGTLLAGKYVCAALGNEKWQEFHRGTGPQSTTTDLPLIDYKKGPNDPIDPSKVVGSWRISGPEADVVSYNYGSGGTYSYAVCRVGAHSNAYAFCGAKAIAATLRTTAPCP